MVTKKVDVSISKIVLFNTLRVKHQQVYIDGNTHIAGLNNIGKTSFLRTLAYLFCGGRREALGLDDRMKSFNDFYFEHRDVNTPKLSMIVYEFRVVETAGDERTERFFTVTAYCPSKPRFLFVDCAYDPSNYVDLSEQQQWKSFSIIEDKLLESVGRDLMRYHRTDSVEEFMSILFGCPSIKSFKTARNSTNPNMLRKFCYFVPRYSNDFDPSMAKVVISKVLTRIICPPNTKKDSLNDLMEYLLFDQDSGRIDLQEVRDNIAKYMVEYAAFRRWREPDSRSAQKSILVNYPKYVEAKNSGRTILSRLRFSYNSAKSRLSQIEVQMSAVLGEISALEGEIARENGTYETRKEELGKEIAILNDRISELEYKKAKFDPYLARKDEFEGIPNFESQKGALDGRLSVLKAGKEEIHRAFDEAKKGLEKIYNDYLLGEYNSRRQVLGTAVAERKDQLKTKLYEEDYAAVDHKYAEKRSEYAGNIAQLESLISDCSRKIAKIDEYRPLQNKIAAQRGSVSVITSDITAVKKEMAGIAKEIDKQRRVLEELPSLKDTMFGYRIADLDRKVAEAASGLETAERSIEDFSESLAGWLTENKPGWESTLGKALREDLLAAKGLNPELSGDGDTLYGVRLDMEGFDVSVNTLVNLEERRKGAEERLNEAKAAYAAVVGEAERWLTGKTEEARSELVRLENESKEAGRRKTELENDFNVANTDLARLTAEQERLQVEMLNDLKQRLDSSKTKLGTLKQESKSIEDEIKAEKNALKKVFDDVI
ncbi:MAG: ATP-binding protein, partial [Bacteroidales bacterium]|nr:ATP-binding protein [Bacteroidales bacterium]